MSKPLKTRYASTDPEAVELGWKLKRVSETHAMRRQALLEEFQAKLEALIKASQTEQDVIFEALARKAGLEAKDYGDGKGWALDIKHIAEGEVALVHLSDETQAGNCQCFVCQLCRSLMGLSDLDDTPATPVVH